MDSPARLEGLDLQAWQIFAADGSRQGCIGAFTDATERGRAEDAMRRQSEAAGYGQAEANLAQAFANQAGVAVENIRLRQRAEQVAVMDERARLARELHGSVAQLLYGLTLFAEAGQGYAEAGEWEKAKHRLARIGEAALQALKEMRLLVHELRPLVLARNGLVGALRQRLNAVERKAGMEAHLLVEDAIELPALVEAELYCVVQEALNNALKHAAATWTRVRLRADGEWVGYRGGGQWDRFRARRGERQGWHGFSHYARTDRAAGRLADCPVCPGGGNDGQGKRKDE